jgi:hypothetical protein
MSNAGDVTAGSRYPDRWFAFVWCLCQGLTLRQTAVRLDIDPHTAAAWRVRLVQFLRHIESDVEPLQPPVLGLGPAPHATPQTPQPLALDPIVPPL